MNRTHTAPALGDLRVSDAEREPTIEILKQAYAEGRIDHGEFDLRVHLAMTAKTRSELAAVTGDLTPSAAPARRHPAHPAHEATGRERLPAAVPHAAGAVTGFVGPLILMLVYNKRSGPVRAHAAEALNFQLTLLLITIATFGLAGVLYAVAWIPCVVAAVLALGGQSFRYPFTLRLVR